ncbi:MAG: hypothetical protein Kow0010_22780 [Dehalococcoidia bacterium]
MSDTARQSPLSRYGGYAALALAAILAFGAAMWAFAVSNDNGSVAAAPGLIETFRPEVGGPAPDFALLDARDQSKVIKLSDFRGTPVVVNWYASWCGPCRAEIPDFVAAQKALQGKVVFLGVNLQEEPDRAVGMLDEFGATYPAVLDQDGSVFRHYGGLGMPTTFFIDAEGNVVEWGSGRVTEEALVAALARLGLQYEPPND